MTHDCQFFREEGDAWTIVTHRCKVNISQNSSDEDETYVKWSSILLNLFCCSSGNVQYLKQIHLQSQSQVENQNNDLGKP